MKREEENEVLVEKEPENIYEAIEQVTGIQRERIEQWKREYGSVQTLELNEGEIYIFRPILRPEMRMIDKMSAEGKLNEEAREDRIFSTCLLFPRFAEHQLDSLPAGIVKSLVNAIFYSSGFLPENVIFRLITRL